MGLIAPKGLDTNWTLGPMLGVHPLQLTDHNTGISLLSSTMCVGSFEFPDRNVDRLDQRLNVPVTCSVVDTQFNSDNTFSALDRVKANEQNRKQKWMKLDEYKCLGI